MFYFPSFNKFATRSSFLFSHSRHGRDRMAVGFTTICAISAYHH